jgi:methyl coenzyme M reductase gamma subunit
MDRGNKFKSSIQMNHPKQRSKDVQLTASDRFEIKAEAFRRMTNHWPPGKDWPAAKGPHDEQDEAEDRVAWSVFCSEYNEVIDRIFQAFENYFRV